MTFGMYVGITGSLIFSTIAVVSALWTINNSLRTLIDLKRKENIK
jgi:hypothetical protein